MFNTNKRLQLILACSVSYCNIILACLSKIGSKAGSKSTPIFSSRHGLPNLTAFSNDLRKSLSDNLMTSNPLSLSCNHNLIYMLKTNNTSRVTAIVFNATFNNISVISWLSVLLNEET